MKSYTLTIIRMTRPLPAVLKWGTRAIWFLPYLIIGVIFYFIPSHWIFVVGLLVGAAAVEWHDEATKTIRRLVAQTVVEIQRKQRRGY